MPTIDETKAQAFAGRMLGMLNDGMLSMMTSIGHQTGLFDAMAKLPASTSGQIAQAAGVNERYVREWLGAMTTSRIVEYDPETKTYRLPAEHSAFLTTAAGPDNMAVFAQFIPFMALVESKVIESFREGGGVPYSEYENFHQVMAEWSAAIHDHELMGKTLPLVPGLMKRLEAGIDVADIGCGSGHAINLMARAVPNSRFTGYDFSEEGIAAGVTEAREMGLTNSRFQVRDVTRLGEVDAFDLITAFDSIHDQAKPGTVLENISRALRDDGTFFMVDVAASSELANNLDHPLGTYLYAISTLHCMTVSLALDGDGLGTMWGEELATKMLKAAGFSNIEVKKMEKDIVNNYYIARKS